MLLSLYTSRDLYLKSSLIQKVRKYTTLKPILIITKITHIKNSYIDLKI